MRVRWITLVLIVGLYFSWQYQSLIAAYMTISTCLIVYGMRQVERQLRTLGEDLKMPMFHGVRVRRIPDGTYARPRIGSADRSSDAPKSSAELLQ